jgi:threonine synthase
MDIQVSSNFERLLFEMNGRDGGLTAEQLRRFRAVGRLDIEADQRDRWIDGTFRAASFDDAATTAEIRRVAGATGMLIDPHTATGVAAARLRGGLAGAGAPTVALATAHPAKFPEAVELATGLRPRLPDHLADLFERPERLHHVANDLVAVQHLVEQLAAG